MTQWACTLGLGMPSVTTAPLEIPRMRFRRAQQVDAVDEPAFTFSEVGRHQRTRARH
jgi:hypothetical protein